MQMRFGVLAEFSSMCDEDIKVGIERLVSVYSTDLFSDFFF